MCLSIPAKVISIEGEKAKVSIGNTISEASLQLVENVQIGDFVLLHTGFAIEVIDEKQAMETINLLNEVYGNSDDP
ncbi:MAG: HypC/HybG/HupF family hydrogenase formation chaperone [Marinifilaceae bacterium]